MSRLTLESVRNARLSHAPAGLRMWEQAAGTLPAMHALHPHAAAIIGDAHEAHAQFMKASLNKARDGGPSADDLFTAHRALARAGANLANSMTSHYAHQAHTTTAYLSDAHADLKRFHAHLTSLGGEEYGHFNKANIDRLGSRLGAMKG